MSVSCTKLQTSEYSTQIISSPVNYNVYSGCCSVLNKVTKLTTELQNEGTLQCMSMTIHLTKSGIMAADPRTEAKLT